MTDVVADPAAIGPDLSQGVDAEAIPEAGVFPGHVDGEAVMLARTSAGLVAMTATCSHYSGPLHQGLRVGDTIHCPWHHACFDLRTGRASKAPALAPVACWRVEELDGKVFVREKLDTPVPSCPKPRSARRMVIVGGGAAGFAAAQRLRALGFDGEIVILSADAGAPYDRPNVSKDYLAGTAEPEWMPLKDEAFYADLSIDVRLDTAVIAIDARARTVTLASGESLAYEKLLLATGAEPIRPSAPGFDGPHVHTLRTMEDADSVLGDIDASQTVAVIGSSFIGMEVAASLRHRGVSVHVIGPEPVPLAGRLGPQIGGLIRSLHEANGVVFHLERRAVAYEDGLMKLDDGSVVAASRVVLGIGVTPRLQLAEQAGLRVDRGVIVDASMRSSDPDIFAAGDMARFPGALGEPVRIEHWVVAERLGQVAAAAMMGEEDAYTDAPFFWSVHYDITIRYVGHAEAWDSIEEIGSVAARDAEVRFIKDGKVIAVATINRDLDALKAGERVPYAR